MSTVSPAGPQPSQQQLEALVNACRSLPQGPFLARAAAFSAAFPSDHAAQDLLGTLYASLGQFALAETAFRTALTARPNAAETRLVYGVTLYELGRYEDACAALSPLAGNADAETYLGLALQGLERFAEAVEYLQAAIEHDPRSFRARNNLGACLMALTRYDEAETALQGALQLVPNYTEAVINLAEVWIARGEHARSLALISQHLEREPNNPNFLAKCGDALQGSGAAADAIAAYRQALALAPERADLHVSLGNAWRGVDQREEALSCFRRAITLAPDKATYLATYGMALEEAGAHREAIAALTRALELDERGDFVRARLYATKMQICDWSAVSDISPHLAALGTGDEAVTPFALLNIETDPARQLARARCYARKYGPIRPTPLFAPPAPDGRIRIGYFSADFHDHATMLLFAGVLRHHDRARFEITAYSFGPQRDDAMRRAVLGSVDRFVDVRSMSNDAVVALARQHSLDIAVDLKGYTQNSRTELFAYRLAPVQINWLGFPGSCGTSFHDYLLGDGIVTPPEVQAYYSEQLIRLPGSYQCNDDTRPIADPAPTRAECGLPEAAFVFCCFNNLYKITPDMFAIWVRLIKAVPGAVLWLFQSNPEAEANLRTAARAAGLNPEQLVFAAREPNPRHLARAANADLFLDTFPCNAHTTASDALWAGLPLITLRGETFASRVAASLLHAAELPELVTATAAGYEALALALAHDPQRLGEIRAKLARNRTRSALFDTARFTRNLETAFAMASKRHSDGLPPADFDVPDCGQDYRAGSAFA